MVQLDHGKMIGAVSRDLDLTPSSLGNWVRRAEANRTKGRTGPTTAEREELAGSAKRIGCLAEEPDILKKAAAFFARSRADEVYLHRGPEANAYGEHSLSVSARDAHRDFYAWQRRPDSTHTCKDRRLTVLVRAHLRSASNDTAARAFMGT